MHFAFLLPWWAIALLVATAALVGLLTYRRGGAPMGESRRAVLAVLRASALLVLLLALFRPLVILEQRNPRGAVVPILVDESRSMRIADAGGRRRIDAAVELLKRTVLPQLSGRFEPQLLAFGDVVSTTDIDHLSAAGEPRTDIAAAVRSVRERFRDRALGGLVVLSDGGGTDASEVADSAVSSPVPVFAIGLGGAPADREVGSVAVDQSNLAASLVDVEAVVSSRGFGAQPFDVRLLLNDRAIDVRRVTPIDGVPSRVGFTVTPDRSPAVYTVEIPADARETVRENNTASIVVEPPGRKRRVLFVEGAPGFEHTFMRRAWSADPSIEVDSVVRKGKNEQGEDQFFVQADPSRTPALITGFPKTKAALFVYDAIVFGNVEWDFLAREQLAMTADFVRERGGGVLVLGARSFASGGLAGTPLDEALPLQLASGRPSVALTANPLPASEEPGADAGAGADENKVRLTAEGREHAMMRVAASIDQNEKQWASLPPLAATNVLGPAKPGASILAVDKFAGSTRPVVAVQRYGRGRSMEFAGEGSWRWKMLMPAADRTHELFWRQALRWLSADAPDPVTIVAPVHAQPAVSTRLDVLVADGDFHPAPNAAVNVRITAPDGQARTATATLADRADGRYSVRFDPDRPGLYRVEAQARQGSQVLGSAASVFLAGASDPEFADPRLNEAVLQRMAAVSGGRYFAADNAGALADFLSKSTSTTTVVEQPRDLWQHPLVFALIAGLLGAEWVLRRRWGMA